MANQKTISKYLIELQSDEKVENVPDPQEIPFIK
jgi:hypothetical protein